MDRDRDRVLRNRHRVPRQPADLAHLRVRLALLDLARVEDDQLTVDRIGHVRAVAVVAERQAVRVHAPLPDRARMLRVRHVDRGQRLDRGAGRVERVPVGREVALVPEPRVQAGRVEHRMAAVLARRRRSTTSPGSWPGCPAPPRADPRLRVEAQRLVRRQHRQRLQRVGLHRVRRVGHVEHRHAERRPGQPQRVEREQQRRVVERAHVAVRVDVAQHLEPARLPLVADQRQVAPVALGPGGRVERGLPGPGPARRPADASPRRSAPAAWRSTAAAGCSAAAPASASARSRARARAGRSVPGSGPIAACPPGSAQPQRATRREHCNEDPDASHLPLLRPPARPGSEPEVRKLYTIRRRGTPVDQKGRREGRQTQQIRPARERSARNSRPRGVFRLPRFDRADLLR